MALVPVLRLLRPANIVTAIADILAGIAISGFFAGDITIYPVILLILSTIGLYGGGVIMNDVFDASLDRVERPERPIPSGQVTEQQATTLGILFLLGGIIAAAFVHENYFSISTIIAITIAVAAIVYDKWGKHHPVIEMKDGACSYKIFHGLQIPIDKQRGVIFKPLKKCSVFYQGNFYCFRNARAPVPV